MRVAVVIPARLSSSRLPNKALLPYAGLPFPALLKRRLRPSVYRPRIVMAASGEPTDDPLADMAEAIDVPVVRGPLDDPLGRVLRAAESVSADVVVRATCDNPMLDARAVDAGVVAWLRSDHPAACNLFSSPVESADPEGYFVDVAETRALRELDREHELPRGWREHVTLGLKKTGRCEPFSVLGEGRDVVWTVDTPDDYRRMSRLFADLGADVDAEQALEWSRQAEVAA